MTDAECTLRHLVGIDVNMAFAAGANGLTVGLGEATHVKAPAFDPKLPGSWLVDLSHVDLSRVKAGKEWKGQTARHGRRTRLGSRASARPRLPCTWLPPLCSGSPPAWSSGRLK